MILLDTNVLGRITDSADPSPRINLQGVGRMLLG